LLDSTPNASPVVVFRIGGKPVETDSEAPYEIVRPLDAELSTLRIHAYLDDGRELTKDRPLPACASGESGAPG